ncbi:MAG: hypothetical protein J6O41_05100 [Clostridia bacterium]|nr:hypothetical protein [Clostridia bacterium]
MSRKKQTKLQKSKKVENDIDINNIDAMFEDMKNLVLEKVEEKEETKNIVIAHEDTNDEEIVNYVNENKDNVVISTDENVIFTNKEGEETFTGPLVKCEFDEEGNLINEGELNAMANGEIKEEDEKEVIEETEIGNIDNEIGPKEPIILNSEEDFDKLYKEEKKEKSKNKNKSKRMTYEEMFGHTWMGYGFSC